MRPKDRRGALERLEDALQQSINQRGLAALRKLKEQDPVRFNRQVNEWEERVYGPIDPMTLKYRASAAASLQARRDACV